MLLDMNGTFMFGEDRFGESEDFSVHYANLGGTFFPSAINGIIHAVYRYLDTRYADEKYRYCFPSVESAIHEVVDEKLDKEEIERIIETFAFHELGYIPADYIATLRKLRQRFALAAVADIWSPKTAWLETFERRHLWSVFHHVVFLRSRHC